MSDGKNLLMVVVDCLGSDALLGDRKSAFTPNLDALREMGTCFPNTVASATYTTPSFASLLTGLYPSAHGVRSLRTHRLSKHYPTLATVLAEDSYHTAAFLTGPLGTEVGMHHGFARFERRDGTDVAWGPWGQSFLTAFPSQLEEPWFVLLHLWALHYPVYVSPQCDSKEYGETRYDRALSSIDTFVGELLVRIDLEKTIVVVTGDHGERTHGARTHMARWVMDHTGPLPGFMGKLARKRLLPKWVSSFGALHGDRVYDILARVPLLIADTGRLSGNTVIPQQVRTIDIAPTILTLLDVDRLRLESCQGISLVPLACGDTLDIPPAITEAHSAIRTKDFRMEELLVGIRTPTWKLVFAPQNPKFRLELYELTNDPGEQRNLAKRFPQVARDLQRKALDILREGDSLRQGAELVSQDEKRIMEERLKDLGYLR